MSLLSFLFYAKEITEMADFKKSVSLMSNAAEAAETAPYTAFSIDFCRLRLYLKFCRKNGTSRITMGLVPFSLCGDMGYLSGLDINISELAGFLRGNGISSLS